MVTRYLLYPDSGFLIGPSLSLPGHDLGLFSPGKLRSDLRNLLADQHSVEEEYEAAAAAATTAALVQLLNPPTPWRVQQRDIMRRIEQLNRQMLKKCQKGSRMSISRPSTQPALPAPNPISTNGTTSSGTSPTTPVEKESSAGAAASPAATAAAAAAATTTSLAASALAATSTNLDLTCGFTEEEVTELLSQGIRPWDEEAPTALAVLRGELDYLLE